MNLFRNNTGPVYPYSGSSVEITGSSAGNSFYYYFYDWEVVPANNCSSNLVPVTVNIGNPVAPTTQPISRCGNGSVNLTASGPGMINWYDKLG